jgi:two-component system phosphate regulon sensor histidine kinase PhoR
VNWLSTTLRVLALLALCAVIGWYYGQPLLAVTLALAALVGYWIFQMRRVQLWLNEPGKPPPEVYGIWGNILSRIYHNQKKGTEARDRLQSTVDYLRASFSSMRDGVLIVDENGNLKWFNQPAQSLLGLRAQDSGQALVNLVRTPEFIRYFNLAQYQEPLQYRSAGEAGSYLRVEVTWFGDGDRLLFIRDVTASMRMENMRKDFVANVSHELRTPLTVISGYLGTFLSDTGSLDPRYIKPLQQMLQQAMRMENLLKDLLWLSRIESEQGIARHDPVDVGAMLAEIQDELSLAHSRKVTLELNLAADRRVYADYRELYSAISNLVQNALKYSEQDRPVIVRWGELNGSYQLTVIDQGIGIDAGQIPRLTERFYRVEDSRASSTGGTGLGLAIVKHVAASHGLRLEIASDLGKGSRFTLVFPPEVQVQGSQRHESVA